MEEMRTHQCERLAAETTADKDARLQQMSALQHKPKRLPAESATERDIRLQQIVPISVKDWQLKLPLKEMPDFTADERQTGS